MAVAVPHRRTANSWVQYAGCVHGRTNFVTVAIGIASFFLMPTAPAKTKTWFRPKGYFTDRQVKIIVNSGESIRLLGIRRPR